MGVGVEDVPLGFELLAYPAEIEDLAVVGDDGAGGVVAHGLRPGGEVDDRQPGVPEAQLRQGRRHPGAVRAAAAHHGDGGQEARVLLRADRRGLAKSDDSAHVVIPGSHSP